MNPIKVQPQTTDCCAKNDPCGLCALFYSDYAIQQLEVHWNNAKALRKDIEELIEEGFTPYAKPLLWRLRKLKPAFPNLDRLRSQINDRIFWGKGRTK